MTFERFEVVREWMPLGVTDPVVREVLPVSAWPDARGLAAERMPPMLDRGPVLGVHLVGIVRLADGTLASVRLASRARSMPLQLTIDGMRGGLPW